MREVIGTSPKCFVTDAWGKKIGQKVTFFIFVMVIKQNEGVMTARMQLSLSLGNLTVRGLRDH